MEEVNFLNIRPTKKGQADSFEELCCQIFKRIIKQAENAKFDRFRGAGGDGGVEAIWTFPSGKKWGMQSKFFNSLGNSQFEQMSKSLEHAKVNHPELEKYIYCIPFNPTGPKGKGKSTSRNNKSEAEKLNQWIQDKEKKLKKEGFTIKLECWSESILRDQLLSVDINGGMRNYWFNHHILSDELFLQHMNEAKAHAGKRYTPDFTVEVSVFQALESFSYTENWMKQINKFLNQAIEIKNDWCSKILPQINEKSAKDIKSLSQNPCCI